MPTEVEDKTLRVSFGYGVKANRGNYQSEDAHVSFSIEETLAADATEEDIARRATELESLLEGGVKLAVFTSLNLAFAENDGVLSPVLDVPDVPVAAPKAQPQRGGYSSQATSKIASAPKFTADLGLGLQEYYDARPLKESGAYKPTAADFRSVDKVGDRYHSVWLYSKEGTPNQEAIDAASAAGLL